MPIKSKITISINMVMSEIEIWTLAESITIITFSNGIQLLHNNYYFQTDNIMRLGGLNNLIMMTIKLIDLLHSMHMHTLIAVDLKSR